MGIASVDSAVADHGLAPELGGRPVEIVLWTDDTRIRLAQHRER